MNLLMLIIPKLVTVYVFASSSEPVSGNGSLLSLALFLLEALVPFLGELGGTTLLLEPDSESLFESLSESESLDESESLPESESLAESESLSESESHGRVAV